MNELENGHRAASAMAPVRRILLKPRRAAQREETGEQLHWITTRDKYLIRDFRHVMRENQTAFWRRFGVTQTRGSRFERGMSMPLPVLMLMRLYLRRRIDDADLIQVSDYANEGPL